MAKVSIIGLGRIGLPLAGHFIREGHHVVGYDTDQRLLEHLTTGKNPLPYEPGLEDYLPKLEIESTLARALEGADACFIAVPTPLVAGKVSGYVVNGPVYQAWAMTKGKPVAIVSTLDPREVRAICFSREIIYNPIFVRQGEVLHDLRFSPFLLLGTDFQDNPLVDRMMTIWGRQAIVADTITVATAALALSATLVARAAWANHLAATAITLGADPRRVLDIIQADPRIGPAFMNAGFPPGGPSLPRFFAAWCDIAPGVPYLSAITMEGLVARERILDRARAWVQANIPDPHPRVGILGTTYKPGGMDTSGAVGLALAQLGWQEGWHCTTYDPAWQHLRSAEPVPGQRDSAEQVIEQSQVILIATPWLQFDLLDFGDKPHVKVEELWP